MTTVDVALHASRADESSVWPASTVPLPCGGLAVGGVPLAEAARAFGTPVCLLDEAEVRDRCRMYAHAFPDADIHYAAKAFLCRAMARWVAEEGLGLDVCSAGELEVAVAAGVPPERIILHGNAKSPEDLSVALRVGVGRVTIDNLSEVTRLAAAVGIHDEPVKVLVRVVPGVSAGAHEKMRTGTGPQKFGLSVTDGSAQHAIARVLARPELELTGLHCHLGSQITSVKPYLTAVRRMVGLMSRIHRSYGCTTRELDLGGGHGIPYRPEETALDITALARTLRTEMSEGCAAVGLPVPRLLIEPGRAVVGPAGVVVHRVLSVKHTEARAFVAVDGGTSDNPRPALYGVRCTPRLVGRLSLAEPTRVTVVGRHCEAGDILASDVQLPGDLRPGDLLAVPAAGAYHLSMASAYDLVGRPPVVAVADGKARLLVRRETLDDLSVRDVG
ncbi:diaminopimelate decarboxylase [Streptomyces sp. NPDC047117]|uniref:diaminopimelate decarboxylase n=1 Tax=Streptomyces sp. NPDC047117 TaxID=3155379 RepID=UPI0033C472AF